MCFHSKHREEASPCNSLGTSNAGVLSLCRLSIVAFVLPASGRLLARKQKKQTVSLGVGTEGWVCFGEVESYLTRGRFLSCARVW